MSGTHLALLSLGVALRSATPLSATLEPVASLLFFRRTSKVSATRSRLQSGLETTPLAAVSAGYCHFLGQFRANSRT